MRGSRAWWSSRPPQSEDHGPVQQTGTIRRSGRLHVLHAGSHHTAGSLLMSVRITMKDYKEELQGRTTRVTSKDTVNLRHGRRTNN